MAESSAEEARARLLDLAPAGFEEAEGDGAVGFAVYTDAEGEAQIRAVFEDAVSTIVLEGWEDAWREFHRPVRAGPIWIGPSWEQPPFGELAVVIDPGRAFGTGAHPTTRLCIELLSIAPRGALLDVGCGSGVLAIAADRLGYRPLLAVDNDPTAIAVARANAAVNGVSLEAHLLDATEDTLPPVDVVVANILLGVVEDLFEHLDARFAITSGYLLGERPRAPGWSCIDARDLDGWAAHLFSRDHR